MAADARTPSGFYPIAPPVRLNRCPICYAERVPILTDRDDREYRARCPNCGFEARFPAGSKAASSVRRWTANELRRMRRAAGPFPDPEPHRTAVNLAAEEGDPHEEV
jgi:hypothetical protein